jgi:hypothetical protein
MLAEMKVKGKESVWGRSTKKRDTACASLETDPSRATQTTKTMSDGASLKER